MKISKAPFGRIREKEVYLYTLQNDHGFIIKITNFGGIVTSMVYPDRLGNEVDMVLGFDNLAQYLEPHPYFGALIGRYGNRIKNGKFEIDGKEYILAKNNGNNHLHGGITGFDKVIWYTEEFNGPDETGLILKYTSKDKEEGYPGNLNCTVIYRLTNNNEFHIEYEAHTDKKTHLNLTHHGYYSLNGCKSDIKDHKIIISAEKYVDVDEESIPTGKILDVENTPLDLRSKKSFSELLPKLDNGYDFNFVLNKKDSSIPEHAATVWCSTTGIRMEVLTTEPGIQLYTSNYLDGTLTGKNNIKYEKQAAFCLETQHYPDSPNQPHFPSTLLNPGEVYTQKTIHKFSIND